ncbi:hypothetical protein HPP92_003698 [Vanilla planifolia]|uniref:Myosin motor domain-containing protein n=1 Tax=Vanilla planifolia TaxID=51239 RepID=A0A835SCD5_VANPL|nr:hypothetical protein HPP92_003698 [Vanilla planifolia]
MLLPIADAAYRAMMNQARSQSILVSGESGAGKTETTKLIMQYLTYVGGRTSGDDRSVEQQVLESNPLLEAFGNAKTVRNDNSSRFGKFVEIQFDGSGRICGAAIRTYLLERSRVAKITDPERNYHCFYQLCASVKEAEMYKLGHASNFHYLNQSNTYELDGRDNSHEFSKTRRAMDIVGISHYDQEAIFRILAAILHLGNVEFAPKKEHDSSEVKDERSYCHLKMAANLFMCDEKVLLSTLCFRYLKTHDGIIAKALDCSAAVASRDTLAKTVYARLFDWLVEKINKSIGQIECSRLMIGLLDIYGFECFKINSFEQFCINFANEKLQQHFNQHIFKMEQEEYTNEQINWSYIDFVDNQDILDLIEKKPVGIVSLLDEACMFPKATHDTFAMKLFQSFPTHPRLEKAKFSKSDFLLSHYAGKACPMNCAMPEEPSRSSYKFSSVARDLSSKIPQADLFVIVALKFELRAILALSLVQGVLEAVRISLAGYPTRRTYSEFVDRFGILASEHKDQRLDEKTLTERILRKLQFKNFQLGKSKVFLRAGQIAILDARRNEILDKAAKLIQCYYRRFFAHRVFHSQRMAAITIQAFYQGYLSRSLFKLKKTNWAATLIQKYIRRWLSRHAFLHLHSATLLIQSSIRIFSKHLELLHWKEQSAAIFIQAHWKMLKACSTFKLYRCSAIFIQCSWRRKVATRELRRLKMAANETGALRKAKNILETKLEDLTLRLTLEKRLRVASEESKAMEV